MRGKSILAGISACLFILAILLGSKLYNPKEVVYEPYRPFPPANGRVLFNLINDYRRELKIAPLKFEDRLCPGANATLDRLPTKFKHYINVHNIRPEKGVKLLGENIVSGNTDSESEVMLLDSWKTSPPHNKSITDPSADLACVVCRSTDTWNYCVAWMGKSEL